MSTPTVKAFFDPCTNTITYVVADPATGCAAVIDPVLDFDPASGRTGTGGADRVIAHVRDRGLTVEWILETHAHADHLSAAQHLRERLGGAVAIGAGIVAVQRTFAALFNLSDVATDGSQFDRLLDDGEGLALGELEIEVLHTPGHTPACVSYRVGDAVFVGDTLFMPDSGTARCDFPGGDASVLYRSIQRLLALPAETRLFVCHDYGADGVREVAWETTVGEERARNIHVGGGAREDDFVRMRRARDETLAVPRLILPALQVNIRAGRLPEPEDNGTRYLKLPLDCF